MFDLILIIPTLDNLQLMGDCLTSFHWRSQFGLCPVIFESVMVKESLKTRPSLNKKLLKIASEPPHQAHG